jgi:hypothetical protein
VGLDPSSAIPTCARGDLAHFSSQKKSDRICAQFLTHPTMCSDEFHRFPTFHNQGNACIFVILNGHLVKEAIHGEPSPLALTGEPSVFGLVTIYEKARNTMKFLSAPRMGVIGLLADPGLSRTIESGCLRPGCMRAHLFDWLAACIHPGSLEPLIGCQHFISIQHRCSLQRNDGRARASKARRKRSVSSFLQSLAAGLNLHEHLSSAWPQGRTRQPNKLTLHPPGLVRLYPGNRSPPCVYRVRKVEGPN